MSGILVVGAGGVGGGLVHRLAVADRRVAVLVGRGEHSRAVISNGGIGLILPGKEECHQSVAAYASVDDVAQQFLAELGIIIVCTKAHHGTITGISGVVEAARRAKHVVAVVPLLNTVDAHENLSEALREKGVNAIVLPADTRGSCCIVRPGVVRRFAPHANIHIDVGPLKSGGDADVVQRTVTALSCEGVRVKRWEWGLAAVWAKCAFAAAAGAVAAACGVPCYEVAKHAPSVILSSRVAAEMRAIAKAEGVDIPASEFVECPIAKFKDRPGMVWSLQRDVLQGRPSEIEAQVGTYVRRAMRLKVDAPTLQFIYAVLLPRAGSEDGLPHIEWPTDLVPALPGKSR